MNQDQMIVSRFSKTILNGLLITSGFFVLDGALLRALPSLNVSYGPVLPTLAILAILRGMVYIVWSLAFAILVLKNIGTQPRNILRLILGLNILLFLLEVYGFYLEPMQLSVGQIEVKVSGLSHPVRIVQLSDIHVERTTRRELAVPGAVNGLNPDLIVITGDFLNESYTQSPESAHDLQNMLSQLHAPFGIYAVNGNVETPAEMVDLLAGLSITTLDNEVVRLPKLDDHIAVLGLSFTNLYYDQKNLTNLMSKTRPDDFSILLYHKPDLAYAARDLHVDLYLTGHTHGGQVRLPVYGAFFANSRYGKTFEMGLYHLDQTTLYVSRGLGMVGGDGPRVRFLCPPEIVVIDLIPANP